MNEGKKRPKDVEWKDIDFEKVTTEYKEGKGDNAVNTVTVTIKQNDVNAEYINKEFDKWAKLRNDDWKSVYQK